MKRTLRTLGAVMLIVGLAILAVPVVVPEIAMANQIHERQQSPDLPVEGPPSFQAMVTTILQELQTSDPPRYREAVTYLPQAVWQADLTPSCDCVANSAGYFGTLAPPEVGSFLWWRAYANFRFVFLHEVGHNVHRDSRWGPLYHFRPIQCRVETHADDYAIQVLGELGDPIPAPFDRVEPACAGDSG